MKLEELRNRLADVDRRIIDLIAQRQAVAGEIGVVKRQEGRATRDFRREKLVMENARARAQELGLSPGVVASVMELLIRSSLASQEKDRVRAEGHGHGLRALVIGGAGKMGRWFADFLDSQGYYVVVADPTQVPGSVAQVQDWRSERDDFAVTVIATPMGVTAQILDGMAQSGRAGLVFDIGSLKSPLIASLRRLAARNVHVASVHPMFGPDTELLSGRHVVFMDAGAPQAVEMARQVFASTMAQQIVMPLEEHDRLMAYVLGLSHALNIAFFTALAESGESVPRLADLSSTTFDAQLAVASRVAHESPDLYYEIQTLNPHGLAPLDDLLRAVQRLADTVRSENKAAFVGLMEQGRTYLARRR